MVQSVKCPTLGFGSGHDLPVGRIKPYIGLCADSMGPAWGSLSVSLSLSVSPLLAHGFFFSSLSK